MSTPNTDSQPRGLRALVKRVAEHATALVRLEIELAQLEVKQKTTAIAVGIGLGVAAAIFGLYALGFLFATIAAGLATFLAVWLALLIVALGLFVVTAILGLVAKAQIEKGSPPVPEQAINEAKLTKAALKGNGR